MCIDLGYNSTIEFEFFGSNQIPLNATFEADVKASPADRADDAVLTTLTSTITVVSSAANIDPNVAGDFVTILSMEFPGADTANWTAREVITDLVRTDVAPHEYMGFTVIIPTNFTITRTS